jgi:hypothetical protein
MLRTALPMAALALTACTSAPASPTLVSLDPYPFHSRPIRPADYRATLRVRR